MMLFPSIASPIDLRSSFLPFKNPSSHRRNPRIRESLLLRVRKRRRRPELRTRSSLDEVFRNLITAFPSLNSLDLIAPSIALASGTALYLSRRIPDPDPNPVVGDWILFTSPTPFNRSVLLRCPSVSFEDGDEGEELLREERHYVNVDRGRIFARRDDKGFEDEMSYQRVCVKTEDGGVISLDWPENLDLGKEYGLDTTVLIVPGTAEGSMDRDVRSFVFDALKNGYFPVVMNPRGCAGSPLTTPRLFTAADSDDVCTAIQFLNRLRPWTTLMGAGWGLGANMLTKYLAEVGQTTPLTAAVCINNPFDVEEATRSFPHHIAMDQKLTGGLVEILRANKELFQGKSKGFNLAKGLSATSVRDFDRAVSVVSYGFNSVEDFYSAISTRKLVNKVKVPVLFIQSDDGTVPLFSVPRNSISENPFTSLLLCSCLPSVTKKSGRSAILWCQQLAIEWLAAVELALLKGRHPLLKDVDITINPSKGVAFVNDEASYKSIPVENRSRGSYNPAQWLLSRKNASGNTSTNLTPSYAVNGFLIDPPANIHNESDSAVHDNRNRSKSATKLHRMQKDEVEMLQSNVTDAHLTNEGGTNSASSEGSQVSQTAAVVMNMLDVTMPGTLDDGQKKKVLTAMEQGETLMKALQGAVPEDVRGKLTTAVTEILQTQGTNLNLDGLKRIGWTHNVASEGKSSIQETSKGTSTTESGFDNTRPSEQRKDDVHSEIQDGSAQPNTQDGNTQDGSSQQNTSNNNSQESIDFSQGKGSRTSVDNEVGSEIGSKPDQTDKSGIESGGIEESIAEKHKVCQSDGKDHRQSANEQDVLDNENDIQVNATKTVDSIVDQNMPMSSPNSQEATSGSSPTSENQVIEKVVNDTQKNEGKTSQDVVDQNVQNTTNPEEPLPQRTSSKPPSISVTQALDALTGFDDSTQMAVNSVFGVIENMIDQFEKASNEESDDEVNNSEDQKYANASEKVDDSINGSNIESDVVQPSNHPENSANKEDAGSCEVTKDNGDENKVTYSLTSSVTNPGNKSLNKVGHLQKFSLDVAGNQYWESPYAAYLHRYFCTQLPTMKPLDLDSTMDLFLDPEEGQWKMIDQVGRTKNNAGEVKQNTNGRVDPIQSSSQQSDLENIVEPSYVILDNEYSKLEYQPAEESEIVHDQQDVIKEEELVFLIKNSLLDALKVEVSRRLGMPDFKELESSLMCDLEHVAAAMSQAVVHDNIVNLNSFSERSDTDPVKFGTIDGDHIVRTISSTVQDASHLKKILPLGVIVGSSLASLRKYFHVVAVHGDDQSKGIRKPEYVKENSCAQESVIKKGQCVDAKDQHAGSDNPVSEAREEFQTVESNNNGIMVGAVTAALGASALLAHHQQQEIDKNQNVQVLSGSANEKGFLHGAHAKLEETAQEKDQSNLVSSLAEKAMSVAGPVVPTKSDGEVDQERLVAILAELGQKGGILRFVGKIALLWGGIRGALSLTDKLISFLHIAKRPLFQRVLSFVCMVLVLWSPVVIPLIPTIVQNWATKASSGIAEYACIIGLYVAVVILIMLWGKRIRGYENPLEQYGLDLTSAYMVTDFLKGLVGGVLIVFCIHSINVVLGYARFSLPSGMPSSSASSLVLLKAYGSILLQAFRGIMVATGIAIVEELLFRSWLAEELSADLGHYHAILLSGLAFSLIQRSLSSIPGFLLLSMVLFGMKQRAHGKLYAPIGMRTGIMATNFILQTGGFLSYWPHSPFWLANTHPWHPFDGAVGLSSCAILAICFYPQPSHEQKTISKTM